MTAERAVAAAVLAAVALGVLLGQPWYVGQIHGGGFPEVPVTGWDGFETVSWVIAASAAASAVLAVLRAPFPATGAAVVAGSLAFWKLLDGPTAIVDFPWSRQPAAYLAAGAGAVLVAASAYLLHERKEVRSWAVS